MKTPPKSKAMSLLITLAFIVIITILVVAFAETVRISRPAAASYLERSRADQFARSGVERVIATLGQQTADTNRNWITQPGQVVVGGLVDDPSTSVDERKVLSTNIPLYSGSASSVVPTDKVLAAPSMNIVTYRDPNSHLITESKDTNNETLKMPISWIYVRQSGAMDTNASPSISTNDPIVGRYAYWTDDESGKINYNIAWGRSGNTNTTGHPTRIELTALTNFTQQYANAVRSFITNTSSSSNYNFFNTPLDAKRLDKVAGAAGVAGVLSTNKFEVTHFNSDPNTTFFNEPRIVLTTRPDRAGWTYKDGQWVGVNGLPWPNGRPYYLRVLKNEGTVYQPNVISSGGLDPGRGNELDGEKVSETISMLALASAPQPSYMQRSDWPMVSGSASIQDKYFSNYPASPPLLRSSRLAELAINIIDYVRAKESPKDLVEPIRGQFKAAETDPKKRFNFGDTDFNSYMGLSRTPHITEIGVWYGLSTMDYPLPAEAIYMTPAVTGDVIYKFKFEVHLPQNYGLSEVNLANLYLLLSAENLRVEPFNQGYCAFRLTNADIYNPSNPGSKILRAGEYAVITHTQSVVSGSTTLRTLPSPRPTKLNAARVSLQGSRGSVNFDIAPLAQGNPVSIDCVPIDADSVAETAVTTAESDDPRVNKQKGDWIARSSGNTLGQKNGRNSVGNPPASVYPPLAPGAPQYDTDSGGNISDASFYMPPPAGKSFTRADGTIDDNTKGQVMSAGELGNVHTGVEGCYRVVLSGTHAVPPGVPWRTLRLQPNQDSTSVVPDWALIDLFTAPIAAPNQYNRYVYAPHDTSFGGRVNVNSQTQPFGFARTTPLAAVFQNATYDSMDSTKVISSGSAKVLAEGIYNRTLAVGGKQYGNSQTYDSVGEIVEMNGIADKGEASEELFRQVANLVTARGNVFSVYSVGQALKQTSNGKLTVVGEQRMQAMVERYADSVGNIHFAPVYLKNLTP